MEPLPVPRGGPSRRRILGQTLAIGAGALAVGLGASACAAPTVLGSGGTRVRYWNLFGGGDGVNMQGMLSDFRKANEDVDLQATTWAWGAPCYTKLAMAGAGGRAPEVAVLHMARLPGFAPGRLLDPFDLGQLAEFGIRPEDFPEGIWERGQIDGKQYAVPLDTHPMVMYYNTDICKKAGLIGADGKLTELTGTEGFLAALNAAKEVTKQPPLVFETVGTGTIGPWRMFSTFYSQTGGTILNEDATKVTIDDDKALEVLEFLRDLPKNGLAIERVDYAGTVATFNSGKSAFFFDGDWEVTTFLTAKLPFSMTRVPGVFGKASAQADCHTFVLPHQNGRGGDTNRAAHQFVAWMLKNSVNWAAGGHVPAYSPVLNSADYRKLEPQSEYRSVIDDVALDPVAWFAGSASPMWLDLGAAFSSAITGTSSPRQALDQAKASLRRLIATPNPFGEGASA